MHYGNHHVKDALSKKPFRILAWLGPGWFARIVLGLARMQLAHPNKSHEFWSGLHKWRCLLSVSFLQLSFLWSMQAGGLSSVKRTALDVICVCVLSGQVSSARRCVPSMCRSHICQRKLNIGSHRVSNRIRV
jgi:hypothetical protein